MEYYSFVNYIKDTLNIDLSKADMKEKFYYYYSYDYLYVMKALELKAEFIDYNVSNYTLEPRFFDIKKTLLD